jgi:hypothetical protein
MPKESPFTFDKENEGLVTDEELQFIFNQSEKLLIETVGSGESVLSRSIILLSILLAIATSEIGYILTVITTEPTPSKMLATVTVLLIYTLFALYKLSFNLFGKQYKLIGSQPKDYLHNWYYKNKFEKLRIKAMMIAEIRSYQDRIDINNGVNKIRWNCFEFALVLTLAIPPIFIFCYTVFSIFLR